MPQYLQPLVTADDIAGLLVPDQRLDIANVLGAAILMPQDQIDLAMWYFAASNKLKNYGGYFNYKDHSVLKMICQAFGVSKSAAIIRLKELDYMEEHAYSDFRDPLEVWNEE